MHQVGHSFLAVTTCEIFLFFNHKTANWKEKKKLDSQEYKSQAFSTGVVSVPSTLPLCRRKGGGIVSVFRERKN